MSTSRRFSTVGSCAVGAMVLLGAAATGTGQVVDGTITQAEYGAPLAAQNIGTGFGNNANELDALFATRHANGELSIGITGNLESNGNGIVLLIDSRLGGCVTGNDLYGNGLVGSVPGRYTDDFGTDTDGGAGISPTPGGSSKLPAGFNPDFALAINGNSGDGTYFVNVIDLRLQNDPPLLGNDNRDIGLPANLVGGPAATDAYMRENGTVNSGTIVHAFNNSNTQGVEGLYDPTPGDPLTATTGVEFQLSADFLGAELDHIGLMAFITNGGGDYLSNQFLPGLGVGDNPGGAGGPGDPLFDAGWFPSLTYASVPVPEPFSAGGGVALMVWLRAGMSRRRRIA